MELPDRGTIEAFAVIVDINEFAGMVSKSTKNDNIAHFICDILLGSIRIVEQNGGIVVGIMGDAFLAVFDNVDSVYMSCIGIAKDIDRLCEYISDHQKSFPKDWHYAKGGAGVKIGIEYGWIDITTMHTDMLGYQKLLIGPPINYASRITSSGRGNRCHVGTEAMKHGMSQWQNSRRHIKSGKRGEKKYSFWKMDLGSIWREGVIEKNEDTYLG